MGFAWGVRITGFICLACCVIATMTVTSRLPRRKPGPWIDVSSFRDPPFVFLAFGSVLVFIGMVIFSHELDPRDDIAWQVYLPPTFISFNTPNSEASHPI